eukprot:301725-Prorocentrum_minimum.AAC.4
MAVASVPAQTRGFLDSCHLGSALFEPSIVGTRGGAKLRRPDSSFDALLGGQERTSTSSWDSVEPEKSRKVSFRRSNMSRVDSLDSISELCDLPDELPQFAYTPLTATAIPEPLQLRGMPDAAGHHGSSLFAVPTEPHVVSRRGKAKARISASSFDALLGGQERTAGRSESDESEKSKRASLLSNVSRVDSLDGELPQFAYTPLTATATPEPLKLRGMPEAAGHHASALFDVPTVVNSQGGAKPKRGRQARCVRRGESMDNL